MQGLKDKVVAITGASSGIGEATALHLAGLGAKVVVGARRLERLDVLAQSIARQGAQVEVIRLDVRSHDSMRSFVDLAIQRFGRIDVLINNAGVMPLSRLEAGQVDEWEETIDVNIKGVLYGIACALPPMKKQGHGHIINVASIGAHRSYPGAAVYCASKFAVWAISDGLRQEELDGDIRVTVVSPGTTTSELADHITDPQAAAAMREFRAITIEPEAIARAIAYAIDQPHEVDVSEIVVRPTRSPA
jgi:NADP-dependent 3-hydroxy acid dehydrogenase YdfG